MVVRFRGSHQEAPAPYKTLLQFIREHSFPITGYYREITRLLFPHLQQSPCLLILDFQHGTTIFTLFQPQLLNRCTTVWTDKRNRCTCCFRILLDIYQFRLINRLNQIRMQF